jgi:hypothetical protein
VAAATAVAHAPAVAFDDEIGSMGRQSAPRQKRRALVTSS